MQPVTAALLLSMWLAALFVLILVDHFRSQDYHNLLDAVRRHRDYRGDDRCWIDDEALYQALPEGYEPPLRDTAVELANCQRYIASRQHPKTEYVSPQREIERLQIQVDGHCQRIAAQSELLTNIAEDQRCLLDTEKELHQARGLVVAIRKLVDDHNVSASFSLEAIDKLLQEFSHARRQ